ncbi:MAG TPA: hypothetical protein VGW10_14920 [Solirubrobacteraceae bacterium]|nr:hypothetical protein [Solirubrobacteraceae bacterium]
MDNSKWASRYDKAAQDFLGDEPVLAAVQVARGGGWAAMGLSQVSGALGLAALMRGKKRAGGLPQQFLLAVTAERVYALALPKMSSGLNPRAVKELARWERSGVRVTGREVAVGTEIVIESPVEGERVSCQGPGGELTDRFVRAAGTGPEAVAA